jgi:hypothetical protein
MKKWFSLRRILVVLLVALVLIQFVRIDTTNPPTDPEKDLLHLTKPTAEVLEIMHAACYDCHSNATKYPWYSHVAPISWWLKDHIDEGREELNFSEWGSYEAQRKSKKLKLCIKLVKNEKMPLPSYTWIHTKARLTKDQRDILERYFESVR